MSKSNSFWDGILYQKKNIKEEEIISEFDSRISKIHSILDSGPIKKGNEDTEKLKNLDKELHDLKEELIDTKRHVEDKGLKIIQDLKSEIDSYKKQMDCNNKLTKENSLAPENLDGTVLDERVNAIEFLVNELENRMTEKIDVLSKDIAHARDMTTDNPASIENKSDESDSRNLLEQLSSTIDAKVEEHTHSIKNDILRFASLISLMQKNEETFKQDINDLKLMKSDIMKMPNETMPKDQGKISKELKHISEKISLLESGEKQLKKEIVGIKSGKDADESRIKKLTGTIDAKIDELRKQVSMIQAGSEIRSESSDKVSILDKKINDVSGVIIGLEDKLEYMKDSVDSFSANLSKLTDHDMSSKVKILESNMSGLSKKLSELQKEDISSRHDIDSLKQELKKEMTEISAIKSNDSDKYQGSERNIILLKKTEDFARQELKSELLGKIAELKEDIEKPGRNEHKNKLVSDISTPSVTQEFTASKSPGFDAATSFARKILPASHKATITPYPSTTKFDTQQHKNDGSYYDDEIGLYGLVDLIGKTDDLLVSGNIENARKQYEYLLSASANIYKTLSQSEAEELRQLIGELHHKLKSALSG